MSSLSLDVAFVALAIASVAGGIGLLTSRNVVHAAFWLLEVAISAAGLFALLEAHYVAVIQLLIYAGAVAILNIFTIMITLRRQEDAIRERDFSLPGAVLAVLFFGLVTFAVFAAPLPARVDLQSYPDVFAFGALLFTPEGWVLPFEIASLVLTAALIAAVWWSREEDD